MREKKHRFFCPVFMHSMYYQENYSLILTEKAKISMNYDGS